MPFAPDDRVSVVLRTGETLAYAPVTRPKGSWQKPLSENELHEKFMDCAGTGMPEAKAASLFERLGALDRLANLRDLPLCMNRKSHPGRWVLSSTYEAEVRAWWGKPVVGTDYSCGESRKNAFCSASSYRGNAM